MSTTSSSSGTRPAPHAAARSARSGSPRERLLFFSDATGVCAAAGPKPDCRHGLGASSRGRRRHAAGGRAAEARRRRAEARRRAAEAGRGARGRQAGRAADDTFFDEVRVGPGFEQKQEDLPFRAPNGALSLNYNAVAVHVLPGAGDAAAARVVLDPQTPYFTIVNDARTVATGRTAITVE